MHGVVRSLGNSKLARILHLPSLAGTGLPERMRTTAFAFLGLTAAAGLALVAIFAQLSFHVLSPTPLPSEPVQGGAVAEAVALDHAPAAFVPADRPRDGAAGGDTGGVGGDSAAGSGRDSGNPAPTQESPVVVPAPSGGGVAAAPAGNPPRDPASAPDPGPSPAPAATSPPAPEPVAAPKPKPKPSSPPAQPASPTQVASAPGNSSSSAAAAHASARGVEASSKSAAAVEAPSPETSSTPAPSASADPGNGKGKAVGHTK